MFLGSLSTATERKARKETKQKKKVKGDDIITPDIKTINELTFLDELLFSKPLTDSSYESSINSPLYLLPLDQRLSIEYTNENNKLIPKEIILDFFHTTSHLLLLDSTINYIINDSISNSNSLVQSAVKYQSDLLEYNYGIERTYGKIVLSKLSIIYDNDLTIESNAKDFIYTAMKSFLLLLNVRYKSYLLVKNKTNGGMSRDDIQEFFEGCNSLMAMKETKSLLTSIYTSTNQPPNIKIIELQKNILELIGFNSEYAVNCLNQINQTYANDSEITAKMQMFAFCAQIACKEACMTNEEKESFYKNIPIVMHNFPHIYISNQQTQFNNIQLANQNALNNNENIEKITAFINKIELLKHSLVNESLYQSNSQRESYYANYISNNSQVFNHYDTALSNVVDRLIKLYDLSDDQLVDLLTIQRIITEDSKSNGPISKEIKLAQIHLFNQLTKKPVSDDQNIPDDATLKIGSIMATLGSLQHISKSLNTMNQPPSSSHDHSHSHNQTHNHSHDHNHSGECSHSDSLKAPDVTSGKADKMER